MNLPVLMYHDITPKDTGDSLTMPVAKLERQLHYIQQKGYHTISLQQYHKYLTTGEALPGKSVMLTFDDGYKSNYQYLYPLLQHYQLKASIFLVTEFVEKAALDETDRYLSVSNLRQMDSRYIDYGYHSLSHSSYGNLPIKEMDADLQKMQAGFGKMEIKTVPLFAYPYGASPRKDADKMALLKQVFKKHQIDGAFRIGNRLSHQPASDPYQIQRIDVRGTDPFWKFKLMLQFGRKWLF